MKKRVMKKTIVLLLILAMGMTLSISTFATAIGPGESDSPEIRGTYRAQAAASPVYSVDISWIGLDFTYNAAYGGVWNPQNHMYEGSQTAGWEGTINISVTNHSNASITATPSYAAAAGYPDTDMTFTPNTLTLATADNGTNGAAGKATTGTIIGTPTGSLPEGTTDAVIGTVTITIS